MTYPLPRQLLQLLRYIEWIHFCYFFFGMSHYRICRKLRQRTLEIVAWKMKLEFEN